jgi:dTDP-glucose 4,6-dehydratase
VTGGAGFIGSAVVRLCLEETDHDVLVLDKFTYAACPEAIAGYDQRRLRSVQADICDEGAVASIFASFDPDCVMHLAAETHVDRSIDGPAAFLQTNVVGTQVLLDGALKHWRGMNANRADHFRFHHISTDEVFGSLGDIGYFSEDSAYDPRSPYSASKAAADHLVRAWHHTYGLPVVISNCSNNYGPWQFPEKLIPLIIMRALAGQPLPVYGTGRNIRDWLHVEDHARALVTILSRGAIGESYNVGGGAEWTNIDVVRLICRMLDDQAPRSDAASHDSAITFVADRPGHDLRYAIDASKIRRELGWAPRETFESGLGRTVAWYLRNRKWLEAARLRYDGSRLGLKATAA